MGFEQLTLVFLGVLNSRVPHLRVRRHRGLVGRDQESSDLFQLFQLVTVLEREIRFRRGLLHGLSIGRLLLSELGRVDGTLVRAGMLALELKRSRFGRGLALLCRTLQRGPCYHVIRFGFGFQLGYLLSNCLGDFVFLGLLLRARGLLKQPGLLIAALLQTAEEAADCGHASYDVPDGMPAAFIRAISSVMSCRDFL